MRPRRLGPLVEGGLPGVLPQKLFRRRERRLRLAHGEVRRLAGLVLGPHGLGRLRHIPEIARLFQSVQKLKICPTYIGGLISTGDGGLMML